ncbi:hypothetical protein OEA41_002743 [Lepraria neglecta]|uniref:Uncharacterized protein n=1 Tax=Lepraria neglecta TaxID=209136 RepID=A0AAD9Z4H1_9LECA|nr:hypothetical protein OEA41_002743 [Lepraria neglecta]
MLFGILSVVSATSQHRAIGLLNDPTALRLWLSRGKPSADHRTEGSKAYLPPYDTLPLESSVSAFLVTQFPRVLLNLAVFLYLVGFGLYLIFSWREEVPNGSADYRNIFVVFVVSVGLSFLHYSVCFVDRVTDAAKVATDFQFRRLGTTLDSSAELQELEATLEKFHQDKDLVTEVRKLTMEIIRLRQSLPGAANN